MVSQCEQIRKEYEDLKTLKKEFDLEYQKAVETGELDKAEELKAELEQKRDALAEKLFNPEKLLERFEKKSLEYIERLLKKGADKDSVAEGLAGLDSDRAWKMRERLLKEGVDKGSVAEGLAGHYITFVWRLRPRKELYKFLRKQEIH